jgi:hypothetical protein
MYTLPTQNNDKSVGEVLRSRKRRLFTRSEKLNERIDEGDKKNFCCNVCHGRDSDRSSHRSHKWTKLLPVSRTIYDRLLGNKETMPQMNRRIPEKKIISNDQSKRIPRIHFSQGYSCRKDTCGEKECYIERNKFNLDYNEVMYWKGTNQKDVCQRKK